MPGAFLYRNIVRWGVGMSAVGALSTAGPSNLLDPQPRVRARWPTGAAAVLVDFGGDRQIDCVAVLSTTLGIAGSSIVARARLSTVDATGAAGDAWDTGSIDAATGPDYAGNVVMIRAAGTATGRYLLVELVDGSASSIDIGLVAAGALWRMSRAQAYGFTEGRIIDDTRERNPMTGAEFPGRALVNARYAAFQTALLSNTEATEHLRTAAALNGAWSDALWIPDIGLSQAELNARSLWGAIARPGDEAGATRPVFPGWSRAWRIIERI